MARVVCFFFVFCTVVLTARTSEALEQPGGAAIPSQMGCDNGANKPTGLAAEFACQCDTAGVCNIGNSCPSENNCPPIPSANCETTLWHAFNDNSCIPTQRSGLDPWSDGSLEPQLYTPTCALTFTVVSRGTAKFKDVFGWYNATGSKPEPSDLHVMLDCDAGKGTSVVFDVLNDPNYAGGEVGFFIATPENHSASGDCAGGNCCASLDRIGQGQGHIYFSERRFNPDEAGSDSLIHLVVYDSRITDRKFYFAWEDIFGGSNNDFSDLITSVEGVECSSGGAACDTGGEGICGHGITTCGSGGEIDCIQLYEPREEVCDSADNNCDGQVDEGNVCKDDVVISCEGIDCGAGQFCRGGVCEDACGLVECPDGETCRGGACFPGCNQCNGIICSNAETCDLATGDCLGAGVNPQNSDAGVGTGGASDAGGGTGPGEIGDPGCGCQASSGSAPPIAFLFLLAFLLYRRRRSDIS